MQNFSLYIDHQSMAPIIRQLESLVHKTESQVGQSYEKHQIRMTIYQQFIRSLHDMYAHDHPEIKLEENLIKIQEILNINGHDVNQKICQNVDNASPIKTRGRRSRAPIPKNLQTQVKLVQWLISCDKIMFQKREIDLKYQELLDSPKKLITLAKIKELVQKYNINALIVKTRGGQQHFFAKETQNTESTIIKKQEQQSINIEKWIQDQQQTINPSKLLLSKQKNPQTTPNQLEPKQQKIASSKDDDQTVVKMLIEQSSNDEAQLRVTQ